MVIDRVMSGKAAPFSTFGISLSPDSDGMEKFHANGTQDDG
jgi:hypothetical protein